MRPGALCAAALVALGACAHVPDPEERVVPTLATALSALPDRPINADRLPKHELFGKVVMVSFIATWCFPCVADLPVMAKLQQELGPKGYVTIAVGMDLEGPKVLRPFAEQYALPYPLVWASDELRAGQTVFGRVNELPTRFLFARDGSLALAFSGVADPQALITAVQKVVEARP
ncbi:MAG: TlpA family protein disulfide reductase [Archangiaceae bacterium]|nr:TlpA family protein disulfide reductase [Archangiaceae bacterium]